MLKRSNVNIELMRDIDMYNMISKNIRGKFCTTGSIRYAKANKRYMNELYDPDDETILYSQHMPITYTENNDRTITIW